MQDILNDLNTRDCVTTYSIYMHEPIFLGKQINSRT